MAKEKTVALSGEVRSLVNCASGVMISDDTTCQRAKVLLDRLVALRTRVEEVLDPIIAKAHEAHKLALAKKKLLLDPIAEAEKTVRQNMTDYLSVKAEKQALHLAKQQRQRDAKVAALRAKGRDAEADMLEDASLVAASGTGIAGVQLKETWVWEVENLNAVPREFLTTNDSKINAVVRACKGATSIPGIRVQLTRSLVNRQ